MRDRIFINGTLRDGWLKEWNEKNYFGIHDLENKDIFLLAVALGLDKPEDIRGGKDGYVRLTYVKTYDRALISSILLGLPEHKEETDKYANADVNYDEAERCAEKGFKVLNEIIESAGGDKELLEKRAFSQLNFLYQKNVATNL